MDDQVQVMDAYELGLAQPEELPGVTDDPYCAAQIKAAQDQLPRHQRAELLRSIISLYEGFLPEKKDRHWYAEFCTTVELACRPFLGETTQVSPPPSVEPVISEEIPELPGVTDDQYCMCLIEDMLQRVPQERRTALHRRYLLALAGCVPDVKSLAWYEQFGATLDKVNNQPGVRKFFHVSASGSESPPPPLTRPPT